MSASEDGYTPMVGGSFEAPFDLQFPAENIGVHSMAVTPVFGLSNDGLETVCKHGTGFFWKQNGRYYLITARHVFSNRNPFTDQLLGTYVPERIRFFPALKTPSGFLRLQSSAVELYKDGRGTWLEDPEFPSLRTDISALELNLSGIDSIAGADLAHLNLSDYEANLVSGVGFDCSILGYPTRHVQDLMTPIWRRGSLASEPRLPIDRKPMFLVDASTGPGFSGGPVFRRHIGPAPVRTPDNKIDVKTASVIRMNLIGVYAGRLEHTHFGAEVPYVFYANRIPKIIASGVRTSVTL